VEKAPKKGFFEGITPVPTKEEIPYLPCDEDIPPSKEDVAGWTNWKWTRIPFGQKKREAATWLAR
jgi:hypothetical protein